MAFQTPSGITVWTVLNAKKGSTFKYVFSKDSMCKIQAIGENKWHNIESIITEMRD